MRYKQKNFLIR